MDKTIEFYHSIFAPEETHSISGHVLQALLGIISADSNLQILVNELDPEYNNLTLKLNTSVAVPLTKQFGEEIAERNIIYNGGRYYIKGLTLWTFDPEKQVAAEIINDIFERHGSEFLGLGYEKQSSGMNSFIKDICDDVMQAPLATTGLTVWSEELVKSHNKTEKTYNLKAVYKNGKESLAKKDAQVPVNKKLKNLFRYLNSTILFKAEDAEWMAIFNKVEAIVNQATTASKIRRGLKSSKNSNEELVA